VCLLVLCLPFVSEIEFFEFVDHFLGVVAVGLPHKGKHEQEAGEGDYENAHDRDAIGVEVVYEGREEDVGQAADYHRETDADVGHLDGVQLGDEDEEYAILHVEAEAEHEEEPQLQDHAGVPAVTRADRALDQEEQDDRAAQTDQEDYSEQRLPLDLGDGGYAEDEVDEFGPVDNDAVEVEVEAELGRDHVGREEEDAGEEEEHAHRQRDCP
jgi:hypothetical protein